MDVCRALGRIVPATSLSAAGFTAGQIAQFDAIIAAVPSEGCGLQPNFAGRSIGSSNMKCGLAAPSSVLYDADVANQRDIPVPYLLFGGKATVQRRRTQMMEYVANDISEFTCAIVEITRAQDNSRQWWRGHAGADWPLVTSLHRKGFENKEVNINARFRMMAKARHLNCPSNQDAFAWLFLMQHYRLPTRLLDWSESPLVALYFAVESEVDDVTDGVLWALAPTRLNHFQLKSDVICMPGSVHVSRLSHEAFVENKANPDQRIISVVTEQSDLRHMVQQSVFTIHGCAIPLNTPPESSAYLARIRVPGCAKRRFRQVLSLFGISRAGLFPDLENLAAELGSLEFVLRAEQAVQTDRA